MWSCTDAREAGTCVIYVMGCNFEFANVMTVLQLYAFVLLALYFYSFEFPYRVRLYSHFYQFHFLDALIRG